MKIELVNHCYQYSRLLAYQLSSLVLHPAPEHVKKHVNLSYTLHCAHREHDPAVHDVLDFFRPKLAGIVDLEVVQQDVGLLRNRAYGRNLSAKATPADWVWFVDTDYAFVDQVWTDLFNATEMELARERPAPFLFPSRVLETDWELGQKLIDAMDVLAVRDVPLVGVPEANKSIAIGGLQIAYGPTVKRIGYCPDLAARGPSTEWNFRSDMRFRRLSAMQPHQVIRLNTIVRIRHPNRGYGGADRHEVRN